MMENAVCICLDIVHHSIMCMHIRIPSGVVGSLGEREGGIERGREREREREGGREGCEMKVKMCLPDVMYMK